MVYEEMRFIYLGGRGSMEDRCRDDEELARQMQEEIDRERDAYMKNDKRIARMIDEMQKKNRLRSWHCIHGGQPHVHSEMARVASPVVATCTDGVTAGDGTDGGQGTEVGTHPHLLKARVIDFRQVQQRGKMMVCHLATVRLKQVLVWVRTSR